MKIKPPRQAQEWSYYSHRESIGEALSSPGIRSNKKTVVAHQLVWRVTCVRTWVKYDAKADGTIQRWRAYLTSLPRKMMQSMAGIHPNELSPADPIQPTFAKNAFVQVIMMLRKTFIQDSMLMMELHPCHPIWQHSLFSDPAYLSFKRDMLQIEAQEHDPAHPLLQQCVPMYSGF
ncbi:hypothetical protein [Absidia glauca]|uniref:Ndc10 domain-containing protein n=1 Tax=Absidia glauca TaxID=4829 RepID=A0A168NNH5_ABSGL|nr:hypothetical protein [Absidia glauca]